jgi:hypothetical protein
VIVSEDPHARDGNLLAEPGSLERSPILPICNGEVIPRFEGIEMVGTKCSYAVAQDLLMKLYGFLVAPKAPVRNSKVVSRG